MANAAQPASNKAATIAWTRSRVLKWIGGIVVIEALLLYGGKPWVTVPTGHVAASTLFGKADVKLLEAGLHLPVNPFRQWHFYDVREKIHQVQATILSQDKLLTEVDVSVRYRLDPNKVVCILRHSGTREDALAVHLEPALRSRLREQGARVRRAEELLADERLVGIQSEVREALAADVKSKGILVESVSLREITRSSYAERKRADEERRAELERFRQEQRMVVERAKAEREAAEEQAKTREVLADAQAYEITKVNEAIGGSPDYVRLRALETLRSISGDPAAKIYFLNGDLPNPLPLMGMDEPRR